MLLNPIKRLWFKLKNYQTRKVLRQIINTQSDKILDLSQKLDRVNTELERLHNELFEKHNKFCISQQELREVKCYAEITTPYSDLPSTAEEYKPYLCEELGRAFTKEIINDSNVHTYVKYDPFGDVNIIQGQISVWLKC